MLTLNRAYFQVREKEAEAFYDLFRVELEARNLDELVHGSLAALARFTNADEAHIFLLDPERSTWVLRATAPDRAGASKTIEAPVRAGRKRSLAPRSVGTASRSAHLLLDPSWAERFAWAWSVPLVSGDRVTGLMQFAFSKRYDWLPREQDLLQAAAERSVVAAEKARLVEDLAAREEQIRKLAEHMLHIEEVERRRISRELHDEAGQSMLYIRLQLEMLEKDVPAEFAVAIGSHSPGDRRHDSRNPASDRGLEPSSSGAARVGGGGSTARQSVAAGSSVHGETAPFRTGAVAEADRNDRLPPHSGMLQQHCEAFSRRECIHFRVFCR